VNVIATVPSLALASRIETALGRAGAASRTGSVVVPQARVNTLRKNADSNDSFMRTSTPGCAQPRFTNLSVQPEQPNDDAN
jgi:hypothetical protein